MKRLLFLSSLIILLASCSSNNPIASLFNSDKSSIAISSYSSYEESSESSNSLTSKPTYEYIDYDLTKMTSTLIMAQVYSMYDDPTPYLNNVVKVSGTFKTDDAYGPEVSCPSLFLFMDSTGCCRYYMEFVLYNIPNCPKEGGSGYPLIDQEATVVGRLISYSEGEIRLVDAIWLS